MAELIIGHTTHDSTRIWLRGDERHPWARVTLKPQPFGEAVCSAELALQRERDYTAVAAFDGLRPDTFYRVHVELASSRGALRRSATTGQAGQLRTSPPPGADGVRFSFLLGSCNLPAPRLESIGALLVSFLGTMAMSQSVQRDRSTWIWPRRAPGRPVSGGWLGRLLWPLLKVFPAILRFGAGRGVWVVWGAVRQVTRFQQPQLRLRSSFLPLLEALRDDPPEERPSFMIHAGDQMYFDIDAPSRPADVDEYRRSYRQAWFEDPSARALLTACPHYMILDDHEIIDGFANQPYLRKYLVPARRAYDEYVQSRQPQEAQGALYYRFEYGQARFFVLDTRTERQPDEQRMIGDSQLELLENWLLENPRALKFVVSGVPFVAQLRPGAASRAAVGEDDREDKWSGAAFRSQRDRIIDFIHVHGTARVVFLVGDMHCTYHATMRVGRPAKRVSIHEIAAGPISQVQFTERRRFHDHFRGVTAEGTPFTTILRSFHGATAAVMHLAVDPATAAGVEPASPLRLRWKVIATSRPSGPGGYQPPPLSGHVSFPEVGG
jgi:hypothetical protein